MNEPFTTFYPSVKLLVLPHGSTGKAVTVPATTSNRTATITPITKGDIQKQQPELYIRAVETIIQFFLVGESCRSCPPDRESLPNICYYFSSAFAIIKAQPYISFTQLSTMSLAKMRTINEAISLIKEADPDSAITYNFIKNLILKEEIRYFKSGRKVILNYDDLLKIINKQ
jgi:hypothetical protein